MLLPKILHRIILILFLAFLASGCAEPQATTVYKPPLSDQGELYFYLQPLPQEMQPLSFTISEISVVPEGGGTIPVMTSAAEISGEEFVGVQKRLATEQLPPGTYSGVILTINQADVATEEGKVDLLPPAAPIRVDLSFSIHRGRSLALFLVLSPEFLVSDGFRFTPRFAAGKPYLPPRNYMGAISQFNENIVTLFNKLTMEVVQIIHTGVGPKGMALDQKEGIVYVAVSGDDAIEIINLTTMGITGRIRLRFGDEPSELTLTSDGRMLIAANYGSGTVSLIDTRSMSERERLFLDPDPSWVVAGKDRQRAYVLHTLSNTLSVIDVTSGSLIASVSLDIAPMRGALSRDGQSLYLVSRYSTDMLVVDTLSLGVTGRIFVGSGASSVHVDPKNNLVYIGKVSGEVAVADPAAGMFIDTFATGADAAYMTIDGEENVLLILSAAGKKVQKFNLVSRRKRAAMEIEEGGHALVVMGEL